MPHKIATQEKSYLDKYQKDIAASIQANIKELGPQNKLREACEYALMNGGKRVRPAIVMMIARGLGLNADVTQAALAIEYFHTASLVADDLPCMDDDNERRNKPSVHKVYGEAAALLVSYALIAGGYGCLQKNAHQIKKSPLPYAYASDHILGLALENAAHNTGLHGATGGQFFDINPPDLTLPTLKEIIHKKTVSLFEIAFVHGWLYGGGDSGRLPAIKKAASHFGMAFQVADDLEDMEQDKKNARSVNFATILGEQATRKFLKQEIEGYHEMLKTLHLDTPELSSLTDGWTA